MDATAGDGLLTVVLAAIDTANQADPNLVQVEGTAVPLALAEGRAAFEWARRLRIPASPGESLLIAARGHHVRRWEHPRSAYPAGRTGYLAWRTRLYDVHAEHLAAIMRAAGYGDDTIGAMARTVRKQGIKTDPDVQTYEDAVSLAFLELQFAPFAARTPREAVVRAVRRTWRKMSDAGRAAALTLPLSPDLQSIVLEALESPSAATPGAE